MFRCSNSGVKAICMGCDIKSQCCKVLAVAASCSWIHFLVDWWRRLCFVSGQLCINSLCPYFEREELSSEWMCTRTLVMDAVASLPPSLWLCLPRRPALNYCLLICSSSSSVQTFISSGHAPRFSFLPLFQLIIPSCGSLTVQEFLPR